MKFRITILLLFISSFLFGQSHKKRVLFLGNSYTYVNNLPQLIADLALTTGDTLIYDSNLIGGYTLDQHFADVNSTNKIKAGGWDYVVLQDQSQVPAFPDYSGFGGQELCSLIEEYNPCARAMFYMTWGRQNGDASNCAAWPPICTYEGMDSLLHKSYMEMAAVNNAEVSPVGAVWKFIRQNSPAINLYQADESHPSASGSYAAACSFYAAIFKKDPALVTYNYVLNSSDAANIRNAAKTIVYDSLSNWYFEEGLPTADFHYMIGTGINEVIFINESVNAENYLWDFGDTDTSSAKNVIHNYLSDGSYTVILTTSSCDLSQVHQATHQVNITFCPFNPTVSPDTLVICPNAIDSLWTQSYSSYQWFDTNGDAIPNETNQFIQLADGGYYSVLATQNGCSEMSRPSVVNTYHQIQTFYVDYVPNRIRPDSVCIGDTVVLILHPNKPPYPDDVNLEWFKNGVAISSSQNDTLLVTESGDYSVSLTDYFYCPGNVTYTSPPLLFTFFNCSLGVSEQDNENSVLIYPNPSSGRIFIESRMTGDNPSSIAVFNVLGETVYGKNLKQQMQNEVNLPGFSSGIYFLKIQAGDKLFIKKLVLQ